MFPNCAGIDIAKNLHYVALKFNDQGEQTVEHFEGFTEDLERMADWRMQNGVEQVAMAATGVYWQCSVLHCQYTSASSKGRDDANTCSLSAKPGGSTPE